MPDIFFFTRQHIKKILGVVFFTALLFFCMYLIFSQRSSDATVKTQSCLNFQSVSITSKDTLWGIAREYYSEEYGSMNDYINEIKRCNSLTSDFIYAGSSLIVPIYTTPKWITRYLSISQSIDTRFFKEKLDNTGICYIIIVHELCSSNCIMRIAQNNLKNIV